MYKIGDIVHDVLQDEDVAIVRVLDNTEPTIYLVLNLADDKNTQHLHTYYVSEDDIHLA